MSEMSIFYTSQKEQDYLNRNPQELDVPVKVERSRSISKSLHKLLDSDFPIISERRRSRSISRTQHILLNTNMTTTEPVKEIPAIVVNDTNEDEPEEITTTTQCQSLHEGRNLLNVVLQMNVDKLMELLFKTNDFIREFHEFRKNINLKHGEWTTNEDGHNVRIVTLSVALNQPVGPKYSMVTEKHTNDISVPGKHYTVNVVASNAGVPYADKFEINTHHCFVAKSNKETLYSVFMKIKFTKSVWGVVKGLIEKNVWAGSDSYYEVLLKRLQAECNSVPSPIKLKTKRLRKVKANKVLEKKEEAAKEVQQQDDEEEEEEEEDDDDEVDAVEGNRLEIEEPVKKKRSINKIKYMPKDIEQKPNYMILFFIVMPIIILICINILLYLKLRKLENDQRYHITDFKIMRMLPKSQEEWLKLFQKQEELHAYEINKWNDFLQIAVNLLHKTENTIKDLINIIIPYNTNIGK